MTDHREDIYQSATRHAEYARWALMADRGELHPFEPDPMCIHCGEDIDHREHNGATGWVHGPMADDGDWLAVCPTPLDTFAEPGEECQECGGEEGEHCPDSAEYADGLAGLLLDVEVWAEITPDGPDMDCARVEILLTCGGPTVWVKVDLGRETVTYSHSWGKRGEADDAPDVDTITLYADEAAPWLEIAESAAEGYR